MYLYFLQNNFVSIMIVIYMFIFLCTQRVLSKKQTKIFVWACIFMAALIILDFMEYYCTYRTKLNPMLHYYTVGMILALRPALLLLFLLLADLYHEKIRIWYFIPCFVNAFFCMTNFLTQWFFYFDDKHNYQPGVLGTVPLIIFILYAVSVNLFSISFFRIKSLGDLSVIFISDIAMVVAFILETVLKYRFIINGIGSITLIYFYLFLHAETYKRDAMTMAYNRHAFEKDIERIKERRVVVTSIDLNNLKTINDTIGHKAGDVAIQTVAKVFHRCLMPYSVFYRIGGDEFVVLSYGRNFDLIQMQMKRIQEIINREGYSVALGSALHEKGMDFEVILAKSDQLMYECKAEMKKNMQ